MSSSPRPAAERPAAATTPALPEIVPFPYDLLPAAEGRVSVDASRNASQSSSGAIAGGSGENSGAREARARLQGREQGQIEAQKNFEEQLSRERAGVSAALTEFARDRADYFQKVEGEVVQLALSIAAKILHREAQLDPLLLAGIVRVALEKIDGATGVRLRAHPQNAAAWRSFLGTHLELASLPEIIEDAAQPLDQCALETSMGTTVIGVEVQLKEIERGLMDLMAARPKAAS